MRATLRLAASFAVLFAITGSVSAGAWTTVLEGVVAWGTPKLSVYVNPDGCPISADALNRAVDVALDTWNHAFASGIQLARVGVPASVTPTDFIGARATVTPVILCDPNFADDNDTDPDYVPASTRVSAAEGHLNYAGILLNAQTGGKAQIGNLSAGQLAVTLSHEMGHVLGLGHSGDSKALMYYSIEDKTVPVLAEDDMQGMAFLYPSNEFTRGAFGCATVHGERAGPLSLLWVVVFVGVCLWAGRRITPRDPNGFKPGRPLAPRE